MAAEVKEFPGDSVEKIVYNIVDKYSQNIPVPNDRSRLAYSLVQYLKGEGDAPSVLVKTTKIEIKGISPEELASRLEADLKNTK